VRSGQVTEVEPRVILRTTPGVSAEQARNARARAWSFIFDSFNRREGEEGGPATALKDDIGSQDGYAVGENVTR
jgi:hypothetical protein